MTRPKKLTRACLAAPWEHVAGAVVGSSLGAAYMRWDAYEREGLNNMITVRGPPCRSTSNREDRLPPLGQTASQQTDTTSPPFIFGRDQILSTGGGARHIQRLIFRRLDRVVCVVWQEFEERESANKRARAAA